MQALILAPSQLFALGPSPRPTSDAYSIRRRCAEHDDGAEFGLPRSQSLHSLPLIPSECDSSFRLNMADFRPRTE